MHCVKCLYCGKTFDAETEDFVKPNSNRYAHAACYQLKQEEENKKNELIDYIVKLFDLKTPGPVIYRQIKNYKTNPEYNYTDDGILKALKYFYEIKKGDKSKANAQLGIVPYIYNEAQEYFNSLEIINKLNAEVLKKNEFKYEVEKVTIPSPQRHEQKRNLFSFLDEEVTDGE